jgi:hypothetical protein
VLRGGSDSRTPIPKVRGAKGRGEDPATCEGVAAGDFQLRELRLRSRPGRHRLRPELGRSAAGREAGWGGGAAFAWPVPRRPPAVPPLGSGLLTSRSGRRDREGGGRGEEEGGRTVPARASKQPGASPASRAARPSVCPAARAW